MEAFDLSARRAPEIYQEREGQHHEAPSGDWCDRRPEPEGEGKKGSKTTSNLSFPGLPAITALTEAW